MRFGDILHGAHGRCGGGDAPFAASTMAHAAEGTAASPIIVSSTPLQPPVDSAARGRARRLAASGCVGPSRDAEQVGGPRVVARATAQTAVYEVDAAAECVDKARTVEFRPLTERSQERTRGGRHLPDQHVQRLWGPSAHGAVVGCRDRRRRARRCVLTNHSCASTSGPLASPG